MGHIQTVFFRNIGEVHHVYAILFGQKRAGIQGFISHLRETAIDPVENGLAALDLYTLRCKIVCKDFESPGGLGGLKIL